ncbi:hypothetical protein AWW66_01405 [Micromonospora rosaria]|uniref:HTH araC/xylS-type domain-containing protein n=1 Tax=Micromonospora rosaria TaxID=47874 RepID=A0A136PZI4_9ACTN|nr:hypothetical protein AWW66_01405 [Micromonospora rosaria]
MHGNDLSVSTQDHPPGDRVDYWRYLMAESLVPMDFQTDRSTAFNASARMVDLGDVTLSIYQFPSLRVIRSPRMTTSSDPEIYKISLPLRGSGVIERDRQSCTSGPGQLSFLDAASPHEVTYVEDAAGRGSTALAVQFPGSMLPFPADQARLLHATCLAGGDDGIAALLANHLVTVARHVDEFTPGDAVRVGGITLDLVSAVIANRLDRVSALPVETRQQASYRQVLAFIESHLADPALGPPAIAAAHHLSLRSLHRLFAQQGRTVSGWIRQRRLERCRRDLVDPRLAHRPVSAVAARWGFRNNAHFTRLFTASVGMSPSAYRRHQQLARQRPPGED